MYTDNSLNDIKNLSVILTGMQWSGRVLRLWTINSLARSFHFANAMVRMTEKKMVLYLCPPVEAISYDK